MSYGRHKWPHIFISLGLGITFLWIGLDILRHADAWIGYIPQQLPFGLDREFTLKMTGIFDALLGALFIMRWWPKTAATLAALHLIGILAVQGIDQIVIRDVGLLGASLALLAWPKRHHRGSYDT
jgi:uncharacterized membrane protein